jgi:3,8-divinyl chlorophyllide a/chlorophyllide a reductase subunit Y
VQSAKEEGTPALYFTNLISARPIFGPAGAGGIAEVIGGAMAGRDRLNRMRDFFDGVGVGHTAGYGHDGVPEKRLNARERNAKARGGKAVTGDAKKSTGLASGRGSAGEDKVPDSVAASEAAEVA